MDSIHEDETAAEVMGVDVVRIKLFAFGLGAFIAGLAGALFAHYSTYVDSVTFNILVGVEILMFALVGGGFSYLGCVRRRRVPLAVAGIPARNQGSDGIDPGLVDQ